MIDDFFIGFEFEFGCNLTRRQLSNEMAKNGWYLKGRKSQKWNIVYDGSIDTGCQYEHEVVSPPMKGSEARKTLKSFFLFMKSINAVTNESTGIHINISFSDKNSNKSVDLLRLLLTVDDVSLTKKYNRYKNSNCNSTGDFFTMNKRITVPDIPSTREESHKHILNHYLKNSSKYQTINLQHWSYSKYIEFRFAGNTGYENRYASISKDITLITNKMSQSCSGKPSRIFDKKFNCLPVEFKKNTMRSVASVVEPFSVSSHFYDSVFDTWDDGEFDIFF